MAGRGGDEPERTIADETVVTKYKNAAEITNKVLKSLIEMCKPDETVLNLCETGDRMLLEETSKVFKKEKEIKKGIAFPTCVSINNCICHFSPLKSDAPIALKDGDLVKLDLGCHIDGFIAVVAHTLVVGASKENKVTGRKADVILAAANAAEAALRLVRPENENYAVTDAIGKVSEAFKCKPVSGMLSHQLKQSVIDGEKSIIQNPTEDQKKGHEKCKFDVDEVYAVDVLISTGEGKGRETVAKPTIFKRTDNIYSLKMKTSRAFFSELEKKHGSMPFTLRSFEDEKKARMGVIECVNHKLVDPFTVLFEKDDQLVAQFKFTVLVKANGNVKITGLPFDEEFKALYESEHKIEDPELQKLLNRSVNPKAANRRKRNAKKAQDDAKDGKDGKQAEVKNED